MSWLDDILGIAESVGYAVDTPRALAYGLLAGRPGERVGGRELLEQYGLVGANIPNQLDWGDVAGFGLETIADPADWLGAGLLGWLGMGRKAAKAAGLAEDVIPEVRAASRALVPVGEVVGGPRLPNVWEINPRNLLSNADVRPYRNPLNPPLVAPVDWSEAELHAASLANRASQTLSPIVANPPVGSWLADDMTGELSQLRRMPISELEFPEGVPRNYTVEQYADWLRQGRQPPPITAAEMPSGANRVYEGHHRAAAATQAGQQDILTWLSPGNPGDPLHGLTYDAAIRQAIAAGKDVPQEAIAKARALEILREAKEASNQARLKASRPGAIPLPGPAPRALAAPTPPFHSRLEKAVGGLQGQKFKAESLQNQLRKAPEGVAQEEMDWVLGGLPKKGIVSREDLLRHVDENQIRVEETLYGRHGNPEAHPLVAEARQLALDNGAEPGTDIWNEAIASAIREAGLDTSKYGGYATPGGENYRELLLKLPVRTPDRTGYEELKRIGRTYGTDSEEYRVTAGRWRGDVENLPDPYRSSHWPDDPNVLAHVRFDERVAPDGTKTLFVQEIQSDWHQAGAKEGYQPTAAQIAESQEQLKTVLARKQQLNAELEALAEEMPRRPSPQADNREFTEWLQHLKKNYYSRPEWQSRIAESQQLDKKQVQLGRILSRRDDLVPNAPFKDNKWAELSLKRMLKWATDNGFDRIAWNDGYLAAQYAGGGAVEKAGALSKWYDETLVNMMNKLIGKEGGKFDPLPIVVEGKEHIVPSFLIPQKTKKRISSKGQPLLSMLPFAFGAGAATAEANQ